jgi:hypothetical protein
MQSLLTSRKFWLVVTGVLAQVVLLATKQVGVDTFTAATTALISALVLAIAHEDAATKSATLPGFTNLLATPEPKAGDAS